MVAGTLELRRNSELNVRQLQIERLSHPCNIAKHQNTTSIFPQLRNSLRLCRIGRHKNNLLSSLDMSAKSSKTPKSAAETLSRVETEDVEEHQEPSAYDRLPAVIATFPAIFKDLEVEQRYID